MSRTLLIIDMQTGFRSARNEGLQERIAHEVRLAKRRRAPILVVEYIGFGPTYAPIKHAIGTYRRIATAQKNQDDGSGEIYMLAKRKGFDLGKWRVCGINIAYCVNKTVRGLRELVPDVDIEIKESACNCRYGKRAGWQIFNECNGQTVKHV